MSSTLFWSRTMPLAQNTILGRLGNGLHIHFDDITHEPLPERWVDLIHHLNEKERAQREGHQAETAPRERRPRSN